MPVSFEWDPEKAAANVRKHDVEFAEAASVFSDPLARIFADEAHSDFEQRELIIGHSRRELLLVVSFTEFALGHIRIISARRATKRELHDYQEQATN